jgi:hypothetical protein
MCQCIFYALARASHRHGGMYMYGRFLTERYVRALSASGKCQVGAEVYSR